MKTRNVTQKRIAWLTANKQDVVLQRCSISIPERHYGYNAKGVDGMSTGGWGWWLRALRIAGIKCDPMNYWSGSAPTPSTAINAGIANYISEFAPAELR